METKEIQGNNPETKEILSFAVELGDVLLRNGGEVYRVEDTVLAILGAFNVEDFDVYVLSNGIFASANEKKDDACSVVRHVPMLSFHLHKVSELNQLSRDICAHKLTIAEGWERLEEIKSIPSASLKMRMFFGALGSGCFCYMFGGSVTGSIIAFFIGALVQLEMDYLSHSYASKFIANILSSMLVAILTLFALWLKLDTAYHSIIIGAIMPMVPGIALTTAIRDFNNGDYLSGSIHLIDAILTAFCIAVGVGVIMILANKYFGGVLPL